MGPYGIQKPVRIQSPLTIVDIKFGYFKKICIDVVEFRFKLICDEDLIDSVTLDPTFFVAELEKNEDLFLLFSQLPQEDRNIYT